MKKILIAITVLATLCAAAFGGNVDQGRIEIGGSAGILTSFGDNRETQFSLNPFAMFYLAKSFALGGSVSFRSFSIGNYSSLIISIGPRAAYYFDIGNPMLYPYIAGGFNYAYWTSDNFHTFSVPLEGGLRFFLNSFVALDAGLNLHFEDENNFMKIQAGFSMFLR